MTHIRHKLKREVPEKVFNEPRPKILYDYLNWVCNNHTVVVEGRDKIKTHVYPETSILYLLEDEKAIWWEEIRKAERQKH